MSHFSWSDSNGCKLTHPEGQLWTDKMLKDDRWGDVVSTHQALRLGFLNVHTFPNYVLHHKNGNIIQLIDENHINCLGLGKMNTCWPLVSTQLQIQESKRSWFDTTISAASYSRHNTRINIQQGGTAIIASNQLTHRSCTREYDTLRRQTMMDFRGRKGTVLRTITAYIQQVN